MKYHNFASQTRPDATCYNISSDDENLIFFTRSDGDRIQVIIRQKFPERELRTFLDIEEFKQMVAKFEELK